MLTTTTSLQLLHRRILICEQRRRLLAEIAFQRRSLATATTTTLTAFPPTDKPPGSSSLGVGTAHYDRHYSSSQGRGGVFVTKVATISSHPVELSQQQRGYSRSVNGKSRKGREHYPMSGGVGGYRGTNDRNRFPEQSGDETGPAWVPKAYRGAVQPSSFELRKPHHNSFPSSFENSRESFPYFPKKRRVTRPSSSSDANGESRISKSAKGDGGGESARGRKQPLRESLVQPDESTYIIERRSKAVMRKAFRLLAIPDEFARVTILYNDVLSSNRPKPSTIAAAENEDGEGCSGSKPSAPTNAKSSSLPLMHNTENRQKFETNEGKIQVTKDIICRIRENCVRIDRRTRAAMKKAKNDSPVSFEQIQETEELYRSLCRLLQDTIVLSSELKNFPECADLNEILDLGELAIISLSRLTSGRNLLLESYKNSPSLSVGSSDYNNNQRADVDNYSTNNSGLVGAVTASFRNFVSKITSLVSTGITSDAVTSDAKLSKPTIERRMTIDDQSLGVTPHLFESVIKMLVVQAEKYVAVDDAEEKKQQQRGSRYSGYPVKRNKRLRKEIQWKLDIDIEIRDKQSLKRTCGRIKYLFRLILEQPGFTPTAEALQMFLETVGKLGTLDDARLCLETYQNNKSTFQELHFALVLKAFLEAAKRETNCSKREEIILEAASAMQEHWDKDYPPHRVDRIIQCSILLLSVVVSSNDSKSSVHIPAHLLDLAKDLVVRTLGNETYLKLLNEIQLPKKLSVDAQVLPLVNFMIQIYSNSENEKDIELGRTMMSYMMACDMWVGSFVVVSFADTFNAVLKGLRKSVENQKTTLSEGQSEIDITPDIEYGQNLMKYMIQSRDPRCWPNADSFLYSFDLLASCSDFPGGLADAGERAEHLLSAMQVLEYHPAKKNVKVTLAHYHRVLNIFSLVTTHFAAKDFAQKSLLLLDKLEVQSSPLLMSDMQIAESTIPSLYDTSLFPGPKLYNTVLTTCSACRNKEEFDTAAEVAIDVYRRVLNFNPSLSNATDRGLMRRARAKLETCIKRLSDSPAKDLLMRDFNRLEEKEKALAFLTDGSIETNKDIETDDDAAMIDEAKEYIG